MNQEVINTTKPRKQAGFFHIKKVFTNVLNEVYFRKTAYIQQMAFKEDRWIVIKGGHFWSDIVERPACYVIFSLTSKKPLYVGQSNKPKTRFKQHFSEAQAKGQETPWGPIETLYCKIKYPKKYGYEAMLEKRLIRKLNPSKNKYKLLVKIRSSL